MRAGVSVVALVDRDLAISTKSLCSSVTTGAGPSVSYGGLAAFIGATFTPVVFCCSVPVVGISNLQTMLESMPP
jgi:hypothetical protein